MTSPDRSARRLHPVAACVIAAICWLALTLLGAVLGLLIGGRAPCAPGPELGCLSAWIVGGTVGALVGAVLGVIPARLLRLRWWFVPLTVALCALAWFAGERLRADQVFWATYGLAPFVSATLARPGQDPRGRLGP